MTLVTEKCMKATLNYVADYMKHFDASHDFQHVMRVHKMALFLYEQEKCNYPEMKKEIVELASLMHDIGDHKYGKADQPPADQQIKSKLLEFGLDPKYADDVALVATNVSYSKEMKRRASPDSLAEFNEILLRHPELRVVQDADRLDAIGAIGIARTFTFNGTRGNPLYGTRESCLQHFEDKLLHLGKFMKTETARALAETGTNRLKLFKEWMEEEICPPQLPHTNK